jgi:hypothetical protein
MNSLHTYIHPHLRQNCVYACVSVCVLSMPATLYACNSLCLQLSMPATLYACNSLCLQLSMPATLYACNSLCLIDVGFIDNCKAQKRSFTVGAFILRTFDSANALAPTYVCMHAIYAYTRNVSVYVCLWWEEHTCLCNHVCMYVCMYVRIHV